MKKENTENFQTRRQFFKKAAYVALPMLGFVMSGCDIFKNALIDTVSGMNSGGYGGGGGGYDYGDEGGSYGCGNYCTSTCKNLCTETCKNLCTETCKGYCVKTSS